MRTDTKSLQQNTDSGQLRQGNLFDRPAKIRNAIAARTPKKHTFPNRQLLAATHDPLTSHLAALDLTKSGRRNNQKAELLEWLRGMPEPLTSAEIASRSGLDRH